MSSPAFVTLVDVPRLLRESNALTNTIAVLDVFCVRSVSRATHRSDAGTGPVPWYLVVSALMEVFATTDYDATKLFRQPLTSYTRARVTGDVVQVPTIQPAQAIFQLLFHSLLQSAVPSTVHLAAEAQAISLARSTLVQCQELHRGRADAADLTSHATVACSLRPSYRCRKASIRWWRPATMS